jgi:hypothetical protein
LRLERCGVRNGNLAGEKVALRLACLLGLRERHSHHHADHERRCVATLC